MQAAGTVDEETGEVAGREGLHQGHGVRAGASRCGSEGLAQRPGSPRSAQRLLSTRLRPARHGGEIEDHFWIDRIEPGKLWLKSADGTALGHRADPGAEAGDGDSASRCGTSAAWWRKSERAGGWSGSRRLRPGMRESWRPGSPTLAHVASGPPSRDVTPQTTRGPDTRGASRTKPDSFGSTRSVARRTCPARSCGNAPGPLRVWISRSTAE